MSANHSKTKKKSSIGFVEGVRRSRPLYLLMLPSIIIFALFTYYPMYGIVIAFKNFTPADGIMGSSWAGLKYFKQYFNSYQFGLTIKNTIIISLYTIAVTFPLPVIMGLLVNQMKAQKFKKFFQVSTYLPHFISTVVMAGMLILFLSPLSYLVPAYATAPALMYVGLLMLSNVAKIDFNDFVDAMAGLITAVFIVLTCNIVTGIMIGFATLVIGRLVSGEWRKLNLGTVIIAVALVVFYAGGWAI